MSRLRACELASEQMEQAKSKGVAAAALATQLCAEMFCFEQIPFIE